MNWENSITTESKILSSKPMSKRTRLSVEFILERLAYSRTKEMNLKISLFNIGTNGHTVKKVSKLLHDLRMSRFFKVAYN